MGSFLWGSMTSHGLGFRVPTLDPGDLGLEKFKNSLNG